MYKYDMHVHSSECSKCAKSTVKQMINAYKKAGYAGFVLTNHFIFGNTSVDRKLPWDEQMKCYWDAVESMRAYAAKKGIDLLFGIEHYYGNGKEVLVYGIDYDFLAANGDIPEITVDEFARRVHEYGGLIVHAHPFRIRDYIKPGIDMNSSVCDGIEVYNASNYPIENEAAVNWNNEHGLIAVSGSDSHSSDSNLIGMAGMAFDTRVTDERQLVRLLKSGRGHMIIDGKVCCG